MSAPKQAQRKYELTDETRVVEGRTVRRIRYLTDVCEAGCTSLSAKKGQLGGFIESERNLSHLGRCVVLDDAVVCERATVIGDSVVKDKVIISGQAIIASSRVEDEARVSGRAVLDQSSVSGIISVNADVVLSHIGWDYYSSGNGNEGEILTRAAHRAQNRESIALYGRHQLETLEVA
ncbi:MAG: hypothetical protein WAO98_09665 [Alphaproteobacteria bacterium]